MSLVVADWWPLPSTVSYWTVAWALGALDSSTVNSMLYPSTADPPLMLARGNVDSTGPLNMTMKFE